MSTPPTPALPAARNVLGQPLVPCSFEPRTGWFRDGCCRTDENDHGRHVVCSVVTAEFLAFSQARGNDLSTPMPAYGFPGLKPGDKWCLCATRWREALEAGKAPGVVLVSTHEKALQTVTIEQLMAHASDAVLA